MRRARNLPTRKSTLESNTLVPMVTYFHRRWAERHLDALIRTISPSTLVTLINASSGVGPLHQRTKQASFISSCNNIFARICHACCRQSLRLTLDSNDSSQQPDLSCSRQVPVADRSRRSTMTILAILFRRRQ